MAEEAIQAVNGRRIRDDIAPPYLTNAKAEHLHSILSALGGEYEKHTHAR
ncbi:hypothetical protein [Arthrobacter sp. Bz4]|nr:hypothetical protein [Arthrobacter sp. Bz4]